MAIFRIFIIIYILIYISKTEGLSSTKDDIVENKIYENIKSYTNTLIGFLGYDKTKNIVEKIIRHFESLVELTREYSSVT